MAKKEVENTAILENYTLSELDLNNADKDIKQIEGEKDTSTKTTVRHLHEQQTRFKEKIYW